MDYKEINEAQSTMHQLAQFVAAIGSNYLPEKSDDSHTNLRWNKSVNQLFSRTIEHHVRLSLDYVNFGLVMYSSQGENFFAIRGANNSGITNWIKEMLQENGIDETKYKLKFNYPFSINMEDETMYEDVAEEYLKALSNWRTAAQNAIDQMKEKSQYSSENRVWPHHFDTGCLLGLGKKELPFDVGFGIGLAIADGIVDRPYFYVYPYGAPEINFDKLPGTHLGEWKDGAWKGSVLPVKVSMEGTVVQNFYEEIIGVLRKRMKLPA